MSDQPPSRRRGIGFGEILGVLANNPADNWLHVAIALVSLGIGFGLKDEGETTTATHA